MASGVEFDEDNLSFGRPAARPGMAASGGYSFGQRQEKGIPGWLIRHHLAKSYASAQLVMVGIIIANIIITFFVIKLFL